LRKVLQAGSKPAEARRRQPILERSSIRALAIVTEPATNESSTLVRTSGEQRVPERVYEQLLESPSNLILIDTPFPDEMLAHLRLMAQRRGHSIYNWTQGLGLASLREHGITVAGSKRLAEALRFVLQSGHFGIYVFPADRPEFTPQVLALLRQIARGKDGGDKRVVIMGTVLDMPSPLERLAFLITHRHGPSQRLRLRDGRWIRE
jgi:hypothetical protein